MSGLPSELQNVPGGPVRRPASKGLLGRISSRLVVLVLVSVFAAVFWLEPWRRTSGIGASLFVPIDSLNIGTTWESEHFSWPLPIENHGQSIVEVQSFSKSCSCLSVQPDSFVLKPGEKTQVRVIIDLRSQRNANGEVALSLWPLVKESGNVAAVGRLGPRWNLTGKVRRALVFERRVFLGRYSELAQPVTGWNVPLTLSIPVQSVLAKCNLAGFEPRVELADSRAGLLHLSPIGTRKVGALEGVVELFPVLKGGEKLPGQRLEFSGAILSDIEAVPSAVQVGGRLLGDTIEENVVLRSLTDQKIVVSRAEAEGEGLSVTALATIHVFQIRQRVVKVGATTNAIRFTIRSAGRKATVTLPVSYTGVEPHKA